MKNKLLLLSILMVLITISFAMAVDFTVNCEDVTPNRGGIVSCNIATTEPIKGFSATVSSETASLNSVDFAPFIDVSDLTQSPPAIGAFSLNENLFSGTLTFQADSAFTLTITGIKATTTAGDDDATFPVTNIVISVSGSGGGGGGATYVCNPGCINLNVCYKSECISPGKADYLTEMESFYDTAEGTAEADPQGWTLSLFSQIANYLRGLFD